MIGLKLTIALLTMAAVSQAAVIHFDELPAQDVNGVSLLGVTFGFNMDATFGTNVGPPASPFIQPPSLEGNSLGTLTLTFAVPTNELSFGVARSIEVNLNPGVSVELFDVANNVIGTYTADLSPSPLFSEGEFSYAGTAAGKAVITFPMPNVAPRFSLDNLTFVSSSVPETGSLVLSGLGLILLGGVRVRRRWPSKR